MKPAAVPSRVRSTAELRAFQRLMKDAVVRPLTPDDGMQRRWRDGRPMAAVAAGFVKPNDRLTSFDRLEIYNRQYWFRLLDCFYDDNPGLRALLGERKFSRLAHAYLVKYPSRSFSLRNLCDRLGKFIREEPRWTAPDTALARDMAGFEWAQIEAFDGESRPLLSPKEIVRSDPARLRLGLQPYLSLLTLAYAVDDFALAVKRGDAALRGEASNAVEAGPKASRRKRGARPRRQRLFVAVHRHDNTLYYKRLEPAAHQILAALRRGRTVAQACAAARDIRPAQVQTWFKEWVELGWFCRRK